MLTLSMLLKSQSRASATFGACFSAYLAWYDENPMSTMVATSAASTSPPEDGVPDGMTNLSFSVGSSMFSISQFVATCKMKELDSEDQKELDSEDQKGVQIGFKDYRVPPASPSLTSAFPFE